MIRKFTLVVTLIVATCSAGLLFASASAASTSGSITVGQNDNRDMDRRDRADRHRRHRHDRQWYRRHRRHRHNGNNNRQ